MSISDDLEEFVEGPYFEPRQYDLLTIDKPEKRRAKPNVELVEILRTVFHYAAERDLYIAAAKLLGAGVGKNSLTLGLGKLCAIPYWRGYVQKMQSSIITLIPRIEQASANAEHEEHPTEMQDILLELRARRARDLSIEKRLVEFMQTIHTPSPIMRKYIKTAAEQVMRAAFRAEPRDGAALVECALNRIEANEQAWIKNQIAQCRVPKDTAQKVIQVMAKLSE